MTQYGYCMICGMQRRHRLTRLGWECCYCHEHQGEEPGRAGWDWSTALAVALVAITLVYVLARAF